MEGLRASWPPKARNYFFHRKPEVVSGQIVMGSVLLLNFKSELEKPDMQKWGFFVSADGV